MAQPSSHWLPCALPCACVYSTCTQVPSVCLTTLAFTVFFLSFQVGERLGVGVTCVLMIEVAKVAMNSWLPQCGELLWCASPRD